VPKPPCCITLLSEVGLSIVSMNTSHFLSDNDIGHEYKISTETPPHIRLVMDIELPEAELARWARNLSRCFSNLQDLGDGFAPGSTFVQVQRKGAKLR